MAQEKHMEDECPFCRAGISKRRLLKIEDDSGNPLRVSIPDELYQRIIAELSNKKE